MFIKNMPIHIHIYMHVYICIQARIRIHTYNVCVARRASMLAPALPPPREHARTRNLICISIIVLEHIASQGPDIAVPPSAVSSESRTSPSRSDGDAAGGGWSGERGMMGGEGRGGDGVTGRYGGSTGQPDDGSTGGDTATTDATMDDCDDDMDDDDGDDDVAVCGSGTTGVALRARRRWR